MKTWRTVALAVGLVVGASVARCQTWQPLNNQPNFKAGTMLLLTDGTVLVHSEPSASQNWYKLTPDINGSYINATWSKVASLPSGYAPLYFSSAVLGDGRVVIEGGEYNKLHAVWTNQGAIYDPLMFVVANGIPSASFAVTVQ